MIHSHSNSRTVQLKVSMVNMTLYLLLAACVLTVSALPIEEQSSRVNGENGWYVPQVDGSTKWMTLAEGDEQLAKYEALEISGRLSKNSVTFYLYTRQNPTKGQVITGTKESIDASNFNPEYPTRFTIHGWNSNYKDGVNTGVASAWFQQGDYNMIAVDWARGRSLEYASSVSAASGAGKKIANLIDFLVKEYKLSLDTLEVVGFSLGAHVAGFTAKQVTTGQVRKVVGLDPAMPLLSYSKPDKRLSSEDAYYVESIQTNGGTLGFTQPIGKAAFYPNGGKTQPGCGIDLTGGCSHTRAVSYYVESLKLDNFPTVKCPTYEEATQNECGSKYSSIRMGSPVNEIVADGQFYVPVNSESPYGLGEEPSEPTTAAPEDNDTTQAPGDDNTSKIQNNYIFNLIIVNVKVDGRPNDSN